MRSRVPGREYGDRCIFASRAGVDEEFETMEVQSAWPRLAMGVRRASAQRGRGRAVVYLICSMEKLEVMFDSPSVLVISFL